MCNMLQFQQPRVHDYISKHLAILDSFLQQYEVPEEAPSSCWLMVVAVVLSRSLVFSPTRDCAAYPPRTAGPRPTACSLAWVSSCSPPVRGSADRQRVRLLDQRSETKNELCENSFAYDDGDYWSPRGI